MHLCTMLYTHWTPLGVPQNYQVLTLSPVHMRPHEPDHSYPPLWTSTYGRHEIHVAILKRLVQCPSGPIAEIRLYGCNLFKTVLLVIYILILYSVQRRNSGKKYQLLCRRRRQDDICVDFHMALDPPL